jgi:hypothetical protein
MNDVVAGIAALDLKIDELASQADLPGLTLLLADDFTYIHSNGNRQDRAEWLQSLLPLVDRRRRVASNVVVDLHDDIAIASGDLDIVWNDRPTVTNRYVRVYRHSGETWRAIGQRTVPAPDRA